MVSTTQGKSRQQEMATLFSVMEYNKRAQQEIAIHKVLANKLRQEALNIHRAWTEESRKRTEVRREAATQQQQLEQQSAESSGQRHMARRISTGLSGKLEVGLEQQPQQDDPTGSTGMNMADGNNDPRRASRNSKNRPSTHGQERIDRNDPAEQGAKEENVSRRHMSRRASSGMKPSQMMESANRQE